MSVAALVTTRLDVAVWIAFALVSVLGFLLISQRQRSAWLLAAVGVIGVQLRGALFRPMAGIDYPRA